MISVSRNSSTTEMEEKEMSKGHLIYLVAYFDNSYQILELFLPFGRKKLWHDISLRNLSLENWIGLEE